MVHASRAVDLVKQFGAVVLAPGYRLSLFAPYPAALEDGYASLLYLKEHAAALGVRSDQLMVGGESAGGGLCAAVCLGPGTRGRCGWLSRCPSIPCWMTGTRSPPGTTTAGSGTPAAITWPGSSTSGGRTGSPPMPPRPGRRTLRTCRRLTASWGRRALLCRDGPVFCEAACRRGPGGAGCLPHGHARLRHDGPGRRPEPSAAETFRQHFAAAQQRFSPPSGREESYDPGDL